MYVDVLYSYLLRSHLMFKTNTPNHCYWGHGLLLWLRRRFWCCHCSLWGSHSSLYGGGSYCICYFSMCTMFHYWSWSVISKNTNTENGSMFPTFLFLFLTMCSLRKFGFAALFMEGSLTYLRVLTPTTVCVW